MTHNPHPDSIEFVLSEAVKIPKCCGLHKCTHPLRTGMWLCSESSMAVRIPFKVSLRCLSRLFICFPHFFFLPPANTDRYFELLQNDFRPVQSQIPAEEKRPPKQLMLPPPCFVFLVVILVQSCVCTKYPLWNYGQNVKTITQCPICIWGILL